MRKPNSYEAEVADNKAHLRRKEASRRHKKIQGNPELCTFIKKSLLELQSPSAISGRLATGLVEGLPYVSRMTIERYYKSLDCELIRLELKKYKTKYNHYNNHNRKCKLTERTFIDKRPKQINNRSRVGDLEVDFIVSCKNGRGRLLTAVDRKTRKCFIKKLYPASEGNLLKLLAEIKTEFPELKSITTDNDLLFAKHSILSTVLQIPIYFCYPYHSWEKGSVENLNKFIRKLLPKGTDFSKCSPEEIQQIQEMANSRYMSVIGYMTPDECYKKLRKR